jgi:transaldolase
MSSTPSAKSLRVKIFADGADMKGILELRRNPLIKGFTTNPTLMKKAGITDCEAFARELLAAVPDLPISFEVFSDEFEEMAREAERIAGWGPNVYVKIPITNTRRQSSAALVKRLAHQGIKVNVTALTTLAQVHEMLPALAEGPPAYLSIFAGRIADTGRDPVPVMASAVELLRPLRNVELLWASPREILNLFQADSIGCHVITVTHDILAKLPLLGRALEDVSLDTVKMFADDARKARL